MNREQQQTEHDLRVSENRASLVVEVPSQLLQRYSLKHSVDVISEPDQNGSEAPSRQRTCWSRYAATASDPNALAESFVSTTADAVVLSASTL